LSRQFSDVAKTAAGLPEAVLYGELVAVLDDGSGVAFERLQSRAGRRGLRRGADVTVHVALFDARLSAASTGGPRLPAGRRRSRAWKAWYQADRRIVRFRPCLSWVKWRERHTTEAVVIGVTGTTPATQALVLSRPTGGRMRAVAQPVRLAVAPLLHASGEDMRKLPATMGGLPGADPVRFWPVKPEVEVEIEVDQRRLEFGRY
jgi:bifunctional non-homologous end joining protein LigD